MPPIYEFECDKCNKVFDALVKIDAKEAECDVCNTLSYKRVFNTCPHIMPSGTYSFGDSIGISSHNWKDY